MRLAFDKVTIGKAKRVWLENGKRRQETKEFWQTINPFNKNSDGTCKTREQILTELHAERREWLDSADGFLTVTQSQRRDEHG